MELLFLGTGAGTPSRLRNVSCTALTIEGGAVWLFDCGEGTQHRILRTPISPAKIEKIFITHLHGDHIFGLPGLLTTRSMLSGSGAVTVYGPKGIKEFVEVSLNLSASYLTYPLDIVELDAGVIYQSERFCVTAQPLNHVVPCFGFRIEEADRPGSLDAGRLKAAGLSPGPLFQRLKTGERVQLDDGRVIDGSAFLSPSTKGRTLAIFGDTAPAESAFLLAKDADVMVHEATLEASMTERANSRGHSTTRQAAQVAKDVGAKRLIVTHLSPRYGKEDEARLLAECQEVFPDVEMARDLASFTV
ncbi:Ribonuclease BN [Leminorella richardii]|uniref:Ribonuclease BN n=1 Tax=Leminorella richardii TaxID=158841 RepID=A0A2X4Y5K2_9GAMM|nr:ribonuclease Z [Leminorella richardii]SQI43814.1 Ribonuclease BN [Leminorella richardii]